MTEEKTEKCNCPFCDETLRRVSSEQAFCRPCRVEFAQCKKCGQLFSEKVKTCPECGTEK